MTRRSRAIAFVVVVAALGAMFGRPRALRAPAPAPSIALHDCDASPEALCGTLDVFEDRRSTTGRKISINVVVLPALEGRTGEPVFWLEGGPGGAATSAMGPVSQQYLRGLRDHHDLVFVDQRGTGKSHPLNCDDIGDSPANIDAYFGRLFPPELIRACRQSLERIANLKHYTTAFAMDDLDDVRRALGYQQINLAGASYGTIAAQVYMRQHPDRVRAAFLAGVATPAFKLPLPFARAAQHAWDRVAADCAAEPACRAAFPKLQDEFRAVLARFEAGPLQVQVTDPATQRERTVALEREAFVERLRGMLYDDERSPHRAFGCASGVSGRFRDVSDHGGPVPARRRLNVTRYVLFGDLLGDRPVHYRGRDRRRNARHVSWRAAHSRAYRRLPRVGERATSTDHLSRR
jgi:pimeloyl-ACP methyl ester carboxylesterase